MLTLKATHGRTGIIKITAFVDGIPVEVTDLNNVVTNADHNLRAAALADGTLDTAIKYVALGNDATAVAATQTALVAEQFRKQVTSQTAGGTGVMTTTVYIAPDEANAFTIEEIGWFAGATATATADTGTMVARVLYNRAKVASESIQIDRTDTFAGV